MQVKIVDLSRNVIVIDMIDDKETIETLRQKYSEIVNVPVENIKFIHNGIVLWNEKKLENYGIKNGGIIHYVYTEGMLITIPYKKYYEMVTIINEQAKEIEKLRNEKQQ